MLQILVQIDIRAAHSTRSVLLFPRFGIRELLFLGEPPPFQKKISTHNSSVFAHRWLALLIIFDHSNRLSPHLPNPLIIYRDRASTF
jgi:hypothetical protein